MTKSRHLRKRSRLGRAYSFTWRFLGGLILAIHAYVLALRLIPVPNTVLIIQRQLSGETIRRDWTPLSEISPFMVEAVIAGEDGRFCEHKGIDVEAVKSALASNQAGGKRRGGSTITQQTAKNVFFWNGGGYVRKAGEAYFATLIDFLWGKPRVMEVYLNVAEWGDGVFGVEAAAKARFGTTAKNLNQQQAALLAAVLPSPNKWRVDPPGPYVQGRAGTLRSRMAVIRSSRYDYCVTGTAPAQPYRGETLPILEAPEIEPPVVEAEVSTAKTLDSRTENDSGTNPEMSDLDFRTPSESAPEESGPISENASEDASDELRDISPPESEPAEGQTLETLDPPQP